MCHLFLHCCMKDGQLTDAETDLAADRIVRLKINRHLDVKLETVRYREYVSSLEDEAAYIHFLVQAIAPVNTLAIYSYCVEMILSDQEINSAEDRLLHTIGDALQVTAAEQDAIQKLVVQRKVMENDSLF